MKIFGVWGPYEAPYIRAIITCPSFHIFSAITFLIDSGASRTTILDSDAIRLGIDHSKLRRFEDGTTGIGGIVDTFIIPDVVLTFRTSEGIHEEQFREIFVLQHTVKGRKIADRIKKLPSLLGRDLINNYKLILNRKEGMVLLTDE